MPRYTTVGGCPNPDPYEPDPLMRLADAFVEDILSLTDDEIMAEVREDGEDPVEVAGATIRIWEAVRAQCRERN